MKKILVFAMLALEAGFLFSCSSDEPEIFEAVSSSSSSIDTDNDPSSSSNEEPSSSSSEPPPPPPSSSSSEPPPPPSSSSSSSELPPPSSSSSSLAGSGSVYYEGQTYRTVKIGEQTWFAENLNYDPGTGNSSCYKGQESYCETYGRLYDWMAAMAVCPIGWHLPSQADWEEMTTYVGGRDTEGKKLKAKSGWNDSGSNGTDDYGFSALPGGRGFSDGGFDSAGGYGYWWSASEHDDGYGYPYRSAYLRSMDYIYDNSYGVLSTKSILYSVRCLKD